MPIYEYECAKCKQVFEEKQSIHDPELKTHPSCGGKVKKLISVSLIKYKGSGFHKTDYPSIRSTRDAKPKIKI